MPHILSLEQLARFKLRLQFIDQDQPPNVQWYPLLRPLNVPLDPRSLSLRLNDTIVDGQRSLSLSLVDDQDKRDDRTPQYVHFHYTFIYQPYSTYSSTG